MAKKNNNHRMTSGEKIVRLEANMENLSKEIVDIKKNHLVSINNKLDSTIRMFQTRLPVWASLVITALFSGCIGLLVLYLSVIGKV